MRSLAPLFERVYAMDSSHCRFKRQEDLIRQKGFDVLVILDACRYDVFADTVDEFMDGELEAVLSPSSTTIDWLRRVWRNGAGADIVYVSASPMINKRGMLEEFDARGTFLDVVEVWDRGWDVATSTHPGYVNLGVRAAIAKMKLRGLKFPGDYKLVVHYIQPHAPYVYLSGVLSRIFRSYPELQDKIVDIGVRRYGIFSGDFSLDYLTLGILREHLKSKEELANALRFLYRANLRYVLAYVADLASKLDGRVVVTADHGELLGEYGLYFHMNLLLPYLRIVPWFTVK